MKKADMDPQEFSILLDQHKHGCSFEFINEVRGKEYRLHGLRIQATKNIDVTNLLIEYGEVNGKHGLLFRNSDVAE